MKLNFSSSSSQEEKTTKQDSEKEKISQVWSFETNDLADDDLIGDMGLGMDDFIDEDELLEHETEKVIIPKTNGIDFFFFFWNIMRINVG